MRRVKLSERLKKFMVKIRQEKREALEKRLFELTAAYHIGREVSSVFDLERCLTILADRIADLMSVEIVSLMLIGKDEDELTINLAKGLDKKIITAGKKVRVGESIAGWVAKTGEPLLIEDIAKDPRFPKFKKKPNKYYTNSSLTVPLKIQDKVIGVINVNNKTSRDIFREKDLDILKTIADLAATAIENVRLQEEAKELDKLRSDFIADVSHELRTPLATINESVGLVLDGIAGEVNEKQKKLLLLARQNIERLRRLIDDLLGLVKLEAGKVTMKRELFDMAGTIKNVIASLEPLAREKEVLIKGLLPDEKVEIWGDMDKLYEVIMNLIDNAIKYNRPKGRVEVGLEETESTIKVWVGDTGVGIPEHDLGKIFVRFRRAEMIGTKKIEGTGLGLSITKEIVHLHGGEISLESHIGKGTKFIVTLPKDLRKWERR